jgi:hypothetical protein
VRDDHPFVLWRLFPVLLMTIPTMAIIGVARQRFGVQHELAA